MLAIIARSARSTSAVLCLLSTFALSLLISACGGGGGGGGLVSSSRSGSGGSSLGVIINATLNVYAADGVTLLTTGVTDANGNLSYAVNNYTGPTVIEVLGDADAQYFDEASASFIAFPAPNRVRAMSPVTGSSIGVTLLTELAVQIAEARGLFPVSAAEVNTVNGQVGAALAPGLSSILSVPTPFNATTGAGSLADNEGGRYALVLAALASLASGDATPALTVLNALIQDLANDSTIDGSDDGTPVSTPWTNFISEMTAGLNSYAATYGTAGLQANSSNQAPSSTTVAGGDTGGGDDQPNGVTQSAIVNAGLQAQYTLKAINNQAGSPYSNDQQVMVIVGSDNSLTVGGGTPLTDPFNRSLSGTVFTNEIIWWDQVNNLEFALSHNDTGVFSEINVGDASNPAANGIPAFLGQLVQDNGGGGEPANLNLVKALAGTYTVTTTDVGVHSRGTVIIDADGNVDFDTGRGITVEQIDAVYDRLDCCSRISIETTSDGTGPRIDLYVDMNNNLVSVEHYPAGFGNGNNTNVQVSSGGGGPVDPEVNNAGKARVSSEGFTGVINGSEYTFLDTILLLPNNSGDGVLRLEASEPGNTLTKWRVFVPGTPGTYDCDDAGNSPVLQFIQSGGFGPNNGAGSGDGSCTVKLVRNDGGIIEGYFVAQLKGAVNDPLKPVTDGYFYIDTNPEQPTGSLPAGESGMSYTVGGTEFLAQPGAVLGNTPNFDYVTLNVGPGAPQSQFFRFPNTTGTYTCGQGPSFRNFYVVFVHGGKTYRGANANTTNPAGSSCTFTVTAVGTMPSSGGNYDGTVEATFSGTFVADDSSTLTVTNGFVRAFGVPPQN